MLVLEVGVYLTKEGSGLLPELGGPLGPIGPFGGSDSRRLCMFPLAHWSSLLW